MGIVSRFFFKGPNGHQLTNQGRGPFYIQSDRLGPQIPGIYFLKFPPLLCGFIFYEEKKKTGTVGLNKKGFFFFQPKL